MGASAPFFMGFAWGRAAIDAEVKSIVAEAVEFAKTSPEPDVKELYTDVYA